MDHITTSSYRFGRGLVRLALAAGLAAGFCTAHAQDKESPQATEQAEGQAQGTAVKAAWADGVSTALGIAAGAVELNPLGPVLAIGMKTVVFQYAKSLPDTEQPAAYAAAASIWSGAAANNMCVAAAIVSGGAFAPACVALGVAWGMKTWNESEHERLFWEGCAMLRQYANEPELKCVYTPPEKTIAAAAPVRVTATGRSHEQFMP